MVYITAISLVLISTVLALIIMELLMHEQGGSNSFYKSKQFKSKKILVVVPHEDDEINLAGATISGFTDVGNEVHIVYYTNGDYEIPAAVRQREAINALAVLGVQKANVHFLGFGDTLVNKKGKHIYDCGNNEVIKSHCGYEKTYLSTEKNGVLYTRDNIVKTFEKILIDIKADIIIAVDLDKHPDHRAASLFFEEAIGNILSINDNDYAPLILKGFAYNMAWNAEPDFYEKTLKSCKYKSDNEHCMDNPHYEWNARLRLPVQQNCRGWFRFNNRIMKALLCHKSQKAVRQISKVINGDQVFWKMQIDSLIFKNEQDIEYIKIKDTDDNYMYRRNCNDNLSYEIEVYPKNTQYKVTLDSKLINTTSNIPLTYGKHILRAETVNGEYDEVVIIRPLFKWIENIAYKYIKLQYKAFWKTMRILKKD